jgi:DNA-binding MarR family transcriptional regulator
MTNAFDNETSLLEYTLEKFWETIPVLWGNIRAYIRVVATEHYDISVEQFHILRFIRRGFCSISQLAEVRNISRPAISQGVNALVNKGLVSRSTSTEDRRVIYLALTPEGNALLDDVFNITRDWMANLLSSFEQHELEKVIQGLEILKKMIV